LDHPADGIVDGLVVGTARHAQIPAAYFYGLSAHEAALAVGHRRF
jgi:hypothetical protein